MNTYTYIAESNPSMAKAICHKYGYKIQGVQTKKDLGVCLEQLVAKEGEPALYDVINNHPDKDLILEMYPKESKLGADGIVAVSTGGGCRCGCVGTCQNRNRYSEYMNFIGEESVRASSVNNQTNAFIMASALLLGAAILAKKL